MLVNKNEGGSLVTAITFNCEWTKIRGDQNVQFYRTKTRGRSKVLKTKSTIIKTSDLVIKVVGTDFGTRSKV